MTSVRKVVSNTALLSAAQILNPLTSIVLVSAIARAHGAEVLGKYSLVLAIFYMATGLGGLNLQTPITRSVAVRKERASDFLVAASALGLVSSLLAIGGAHVFVELLDYSPDVSHAVSVLIWAVIPSMLIMYCEALFIAFHKAQYIAGISIGENVAKVVVGLILISTGKGILELFVAFLSLRICACATFLVLFSAKIGPIKGRLDREIVSELRKVGPVFTGNLLIETLFGKVDVLLLSKLATMADVGYYSVALRLILIAKLVPQSFTSAVLPVMCEVLLESKEKCNRLFTRSANYMAAYGFAAALIVVILSEALIIIVYGEHAPEAELVLSLLALAIVPGSLTPVLAAMLFAANREKLDLWANLLRVALLVVLCVVLIPLRSSLGAAMAFIISQVLFLGSLALLVRHAVLSARIAPSLLCPVFAASLGYGISYFVPEMAPLIRGLLQSVLALLIYMMILVALLPALRNDLIIFSRESLTMLQQMLEVAFNFRSR